MATKPRKTSSKLAIYLADLVQDPKKLSDLKANPHKEMARADLSNDEKNALIRADKEELTNVLKKHDPKLAANVSITICVF